MHQQKIIESVKNVYDEISSEFSASRQYIWPDLKPYISLVKPGSSVLDVGCGNGRLLLGLPQNIKYVGLDISSRLLNEAQSAYPKHTFLETDIAQESYWKHLPRFDYIFCIAVIHHLPSLKDQVFVLEQIKKHLKPKGKVLITTWNLWQPKYFRYHFDLDTKLQNPHFVYIPFQGKPRFCFAYTRPYLSQLLRLTKLPLKLKRSRYNYLLTNFQSNLP